MEFIDEIFNTLDDVSDVAVSTLNNATGLLSKTLLNEINDTIATLTKDSAGNIIPSVENIKKVNLLSSKLEVYFTSAEYKQAIGVFLGTYNSNVKLINTYFETVSQDFKASDVIYKQIASLSKDATIDSLMGSGISANVKEPLINILKSSITSGSNRTDVFALLQTAIEGDKTNLGYLERYIKQIGNDAITQFNSNYIKTVGLDLGLDHYYYKGTRVAETREFCDAYAGKFYTEEKLQQIVTSQSISRGGKGWQGMIKGTNWSNFSVYRGGWNCRHYLIPISKAVYDSKGEDKRG